MEGRIPILAKAIALMTMVCCTQHASGATATATITATISEAATEEDGLAFAPVQLDMRGKSSEQIAITNRSNRWRDLDVELVALSASSDGCDLRYSPQRSTLPPDGYQVVRLLFRADHANACHTNYQLVVTDQANQGSHLFTLPVYTTSE